MENLREFGIISRSIGEISERTRENGEEKTGAREHLKVKAAVLIE